MKCPKCKKTIKQEWLRVGPAMQKLVDVCGCNVAAKRFRDLNEIYFDKYKKPTAFYENPITGQEYAVDKTGKKIDIEDTRYDLKRDPHGWKATGKTPKKRKYFI